jgi:hypothetical protein
MPDPKLRTTEEYEEYARKALQRGMNDKRIAEHLVKAGVDRPEANRIARKIWKENTGTRRENAIILLGTATFFLSVFLIFQLLPVIRGEGWPEPSVIYILLVPAGWFFYKAFQAYRETLL